MVDPARIRATSTEHGAATSTSPRTAGHHRLAAQRANPERPITDPTVQEWNGVENAALLTDDLLDAVIANGRARHAGRAFAATQRWALLGEPELACVLDRLAGVTNRTLVIAGRQDKVVPVGDSIVAAGLLPHGRVEVLEACGHWLVRDRPEVFISLVDAFLDEAGA